MWRSTLVFLLAVVGPLCSGSASAEMDHGLSFSDFFVSTSDVDFFNSVYQRQTFIDKRKDAEDAAAFSPAMEALTEQLQDPQSLCQRHFANGGSDRALQIKEQSETRKVESCEHMNRELDNGAGLLIRFEDLVDSPADQSTRRLQDSVRQVFGTESTAHLYHATQHDSRALMPHTDPYDVLVIQLQGSKRWTQCVPNAYATEKEEEQQQQPQQRQANEQDQDHHSEDKSTLRLTSHHLSETETIERFNDAQLGQLQEIRRQKQQGCTAYDDHDLRGMKCDHFTLHAGDTMYMPKGIIHFALAGGEGSSHITISLERKGLSWADALMHAAAKGANIVDNPTFLARWSQAIQALTGSYKGVPYLEAMPSWHLHAEDNRLCGGSSEEREQLVAAFQDMCWDLLPHVQEAYESAKDLEAVFNPDGITALTERVCSEEAAQAVVDELCAKGRMPVDVTSPKFRRMKLAHVHRQRRDTVTASYTCTTGCDSKCNVYNCKCDDTCTGSCDGGCTNCNSNCDSQQCNGSCDTSCDGKTCTGSCDDSCDTRTCYEDCDTCTSCDGSCDGECNDSCDDSCDFWFFGWGGCDSDCDRSCDSDCDSDCDNCYASCDTNCIYNQDCNGGCDSNCVFNKDCDSGCNSNCDGTSCDGSCGGPCNTDCDTCNTGCDGCPDTSTCNDSCDGGCKCNPAYYGSGKDCTVCPTGTYASSSGQSSCTECTCGQPGYYSLSCGGSSAGRCVQCPACPAGEQRVGCEGISDGSCTACPAGTYKPTQGNQACINCKPCDPGYERVGCEGSSAGQCVGITCKSPPSIDNADVSVSNEAVFPSTATYTCKTGYQLANDNENTLSCSATGEWEGAMPRCVGVSCPDLSIENGLVLPTGTIRFPAVAQFSCDKGYVLEGTTSAQCQADSTWAADPPACTGRRCTQLEAPRYGSVTFSNSRQYPSTATYSCDEGYELYDGDTTRTCNADTAVFEGAAPRCRGVLCNSISAPDGGTVAFMPNPARYPASAEFSCSAGYTLVGEPKITCNKDKTWTADPPTCQGVVCPAPSIDNAVVTAESERYPTDASVKCDAGYGLVGPSTLTCRTDGSWGALPTCELCGVNSYAETSSSPCRPCPSGSSTNGERGASKCECLPEHEPSDDGEGTCTPCKDNTIKPEWGSTKCQACDAGHQTENGDFTKCVGVPCNTVPDIRNGHANSTSSFRYPATVSYECDTGFKLANPDLSSSTCQTDGTWTAAPSCTYICGDGIVVEGEECDDKNTDDNDGCSAACQLEDTHACIEQGQECKYCNFTTRPEMLNLACDDPDLDSKVEEWAAVAGNADVLDHLHCGDPTFTFEAGRIKGTQPGCYRQVYEFTAEFNEGKVDELITGALKVYDNTAPSFSSVPSSVTADCHNVPDFADIAARDACMADEPAVTKRETRKDGACPQAYTLTRSWSVEDECGNSKMAQQVVTVQDVEAPVFTSPPTNRELECSADPRADIDALIEQHVNAGATDKCTEALSYETTETATNLDGCGGTGSVTLQVAVSDECGNAVQQPVTVTVVDGTAPQPVNVPGHTTVECSATPPMPTDVYAMDACNSQRVDAETSEERIDGACPYTYQLRRRFSFTDACGNAVSSTQKVSVQDTLAPEIVKQPEDLALECHGENNDQAIAHWLSKNGGAEAVDACSSKDKLTWANDYDTSNNGGFPGGCSAGTGQVEVTFTVSDECGHRSSVTSRIKIEDTRPPAFTTQLEPVTATCDRVPEATMPQAFDNCTGDVTPTLSTERMEGACAHQYGLVHRWEAEDECGLTSVQKQAVTVTDRAAPTVTKESQDMVVECRLGQDQEKLQSFLANQGQAQASEVCGGVRWLHADAEEEDFDVSGGASGAVVQEAGCGNTFSAFATFYAVDECANAASTSAHFRVEDTLAPVLGEVPDEEVEASCHAVPELQDITAMDQCEGALVAVGSERRTEGKCPQAYTLTRSWSVEDECGHSAEASQLVTVTDTMAPTIETDASDLVLECSNETEAMIAAWLEARGHALASDNCDTELTWRHNFEQVKEELQYGCGLNEVTVTFTVADECGNEATTEAVVHVVDTTPPTITTLPSSQTAECNPETNPQELSAFLQSFGGAQASDICSGIVGGQVTWSHEMGKQMTCGDTYDSVVNFTATDACGNSASAFATLAFVDTQAPVINLRGANPQLAQAAFRWIDPSVELATDKCHSALSAEQVEVVNPPNTTVLGNTTVVYRVEDACGLMGTATREVVVVDTLPPKMEVLGQEQMFVRVGTVFNDPGVRVWDSVWSDVVVGAKVLAEGEEHPGVDTAPQVAGRSVFHVVYTAEDGAGNTATRVGRTVRVLAAPERSPAWSSVTLTFDRALSLGVPVLPSKAETGDREPFYVARAATSVPVKEGDSLETDGLHALLGGDVHAVVIASGPGQAYVELHAVLGGATPEVVAAARASSKVEAMTNLTRVVSFFGSHHSNEGPRAGLDNIKDLLKRRGRTLVHAECEEYVCLYQALEPATDGSFDAPQLEETVQYHVTLRSADDRAFNLTTLELKLQELGIVPVLLQAGSDGKKTASFVTRARLPNSDAGLEPANADIQSVRPVVAARVEVAVETDPGRMTILSDLYGLGLVPVNWTIEQVEGARVLVVETHNDVTAKTVEQLGAVEWVIGSVAVSYVEPQALELPAWSCNYTVTAAVNSSAADVASAVNASLHTVGLTLDVDYRLYGCEQENVAECVVETRQTLTAAAVAAVEGMAAVANVTEDSCFCLDDELVASIRKQLFAELPYPEDLVSFSTDDPALRRSSQLTVTISFDARSEPQLVAGDAAPSYVIPDGRFLLHFRVVNGSTGNVARALAAEALGGAGVPTVEISVTGDEVAAVVVEPLSTERQELLDAQSQVVNGSVTNPVTLNAELALEDAVEVLMAMVGAGEVEGLVLGRRLPTVNAETPYTSTTTTTTTSTTKTSTTTTARSTLAPTVTTGDGGSSGASSSDSTGVTMWQIAVAVAAGAIMCTLVVLFVLARRRSTKNTKVEQPAVAFINTAHNRPGEAVGGWDGGIMGKVDGRGMVSNPLYEGADDFDEAARMNMYADVAGKDEPPVMSFKAVGDDNPVYADVDSEDDDDAVYTIVEGRGMMKNLPNEGADDDDNAARMNIYADVAAKDEPSDMSYMAVGDDNPVYLGFDSEDDDDAVYTIVEGRGMVKNPVFEGADDDDEAARMNMYVDVVAKDETPVSSYMTVCDDNPVYVDVDNEGDDDAVYADASELNLFDFQPNKSDGAGANRAVADDLYITFDTPGDRSDDDDDLVFGFGDATYSGVDNNE